MTFNFDTSELTQTTARRITPHDNCIVTELSSGAFPRYIKVQLPDEDGPQQVALWDGSLDLEVNDEVYCHEYAEIPIWRIMAMGGNDSGAGKQRVSKVWESDFENVVMSIDAAGLVTFQPAADSVTFLQVLDAASAVVWDVDTTNGRVGIGTASPAQQLHLSGTTTPLVLIERSDTFNAEIQLKDTTTTGNIRMSAGKMHISSTTGTNGNIVIDSAGDVGIGTANPAGFKLHLSESVNGDLSFNGANVNTGTSARTNFTFQNNVGTANFGLGGGNYTVISDWQNALFFNNLLAGGLSFATDNVTRLKILETGNVGVGGLSPGTIFDVLDEDAVTAATTDIITIGHNSTGSPISADFGAGLLYQLESTASEDQDAARIAALWTTATHASRASALVFETVDNAGSLTEQIRINGDGNVGIGIATAPSGKLHIDNASIAQPVAYFDQGDVSEQMRQFETTIGVGNAIEAAGLKVLTVTHFVKDTLPGGLTRYTPYGTISTTGPKFTKNETVTTQGLGANPDVFAFGNYEFSVADANLTQASTTQTFGTANVSYAAHAFAVTSGAGSVDTGVIGLRVNGTSINDQGTRTTSDTETIIADITASSTDDYQETAKKWLGQVTYELFTVSGSPTTFSLDFNYGRAKYDDWFNTDFTITDIEAVGFAGANDSAFDIKLMHHQATGWIYSAAAFTPITAANTVASLAADHSTDDQLLSSQHMAWKRDNLSEAIDGANGEGFLIFVSSSANNAIEYLNLHIGVVF